MDTNLALAIVTLLWALSEVLSYIPAIKANGVFQLICNVLRKVTGRG